MFISFIGRCVILCLLHLCPLFLILLGVSLCDICMFNKDSGSKQ